MSDADGFFRVAAIDHPENYLALFDADVSKVSFAEVVASKLELLSAMAPHCTAVLVDPVWSFGQGILTGAIPGNIGLISGVERLAYTPDGFGTETVLREHWTVPKLARLGADGVKLVVFYREEQTEVCAQQHRIVAQLAGECEANDMPLIVEPIWYPLEGESLEDPRVRSARPSSIIDAAGIFSRLGADVMKVEFPGYVGSPTDEEAAVSACERLHAAVGVPWVLLSSSATFEQFATQVRIAGTAGASGFMAGRAIWGDGVGRYDDERRARGARTAAERLDILAGLLREHGRPGWRPMPVSRAIEDLGPDWYHSY